MRYSLSLPVIVELSGMPRLGKTTISDMLVDLFKMSGFKTRLLSLATHSSPIDDRWSFDFTAWTFFSLVSSYLELKHQGVVFSVADRGLFDSIIWLRIKAKKGLVSEKYVDIFREVALLPPWGESILIVMPFVGSIEDVVNRHNRLKLYKGPSIVSTEDVLYMLKSEIIEESREWLGRGKRVSVIEVNDEPVHIRGYMCATKVIEALKEEGFSGVKHIESVLKKPMTTEDLLSLK